MSFPLTTHVQTSIIKVALDAYLSVGGTSIQSVSFYGKIETHADLYIDATVKVGIYTWEKFSLKTR